MEAGMIDQGKKNVLGVDVNVIDYEGATRRIVEAARNQRPLSATALAVHGVMTGVSDPRHRFRLNHFDLVTPDGQPVRWAMKLLHGVALPDRVYGPTLTLHVCKRAAVESLPIYLYGSTRPIVEKMAQNLGRRFPGLQIAGVEPSKFRQTTSSEKQELVARIRRSGAAVTFVGLGCPRQEVFAYEYRDDLAMPVIAVGAAFDYHAGIRSEPPMWIQNAGLQWLYRLGQDPRRLWRRYLITNTKFVSLLALQSAGVWRPPSDPPAPVEEVLYG
jgi:N-acetylglucosaminyldiphosphoundecaprenol N-acetyl-beta-D-mannosaminyltransferase